MDNGLTPASFSSPSNLPKRRLNALEVEKEKALAAKERLAESLQRAQATVATRQEELAAAKRVHQSLARRRRQIDTACPRDARLPSPALLCGSLVFGGSSTGVGAWLVAGGSVAAGGSLVGLGALALMPLAASCGGVTIRGCHYLLQPSPAARDRARQLVVTAESNLSQATDSEDHLKRNAQRIALGLEILDELSNVYLPPVLANIVVEYLVEPQGPPAGSSPPKIEVME